MRNDLPDGTKGIDHTGKIGCQHGMMNVVMSHQFLEKATGKMSVELSGRKSKVRKLNRCGRNDR